MIRNITLALAACAAVAMMLAPDWASAQRRLLPNSGICESGQRVPDTKMCKENQGKVRHPDGWRKKKG